MVNKMWWEHGVPTLKPATTRKTPSQGQETCISTFCVLTLTWQGQYAASGQAEALFGIQLLTLEFFKYMHISQCGQCSHEAEQQQLHCTCLYNPSLGLTFFSYFFRSVMGCGWELLWLCPPGPYRRSFLAITML